MYSVCEIANINARKVLRRVLVTSIQFLSCLACRNKRIWKPNAVKANLYSDILDERIKMNVTTHALR